MKRFIEIEIKNIKVTKRYFSFFYTIYVDKIHKLSGEYSDSHNRVDDIEDFIHDLESNYAYELVLESYHGDIFE